jgi:hypothetical protein
VCADVLVVKEAVQDHGASGTGERVADASISLINWGQRRQCPAALARRQPGTPLRNTTGPFHLATLSLRRPRHRPPASDAMNAGT